MGRQGKHVTKKPAAWRRPATLTTVGMAATAAILVAAYLGATHSAGSRAARPSQPPAAQALASAGKGASAITVKGLRLRLAAESATTSPPQGPLVLTTRDHHMCPPAATACVDLARHLTWLQSGAKVTFGPVWMEPGAPGAATSTPRGTFAVLWKGGPKVISNIFDEPMPWAVQFTSSGSAFHAGSLTTPSHGCVHLTMADAHIYNESLAIGDEVVVF